MARYCESPDAPCTKQLESHRREITALFCDLRGFTGFTESADAEDVMALLRVQAALSGVRAAMTLVYQQVLLENRQDALAFAVETCAANRRLLHLLRARGSEVRSGGTRPFKRFPMLSA